jgi:hypothetical protein
MSNAFWLFWAVPSWYFATIASPLAAGPLTAIPALGILCLAIGLLWGVAKRETGLLIFLMPLAASQLLVIVAGFLRGVFRPDSYYMISWITGAFILFQIAASAYIVWRLRGARWSAAAITIFNLSYALHAGFVATMAFSDDWL